MKLGGLYLLPVKRQCELVVGIQNKRVSRLDTIHDCRPTPCPCTNPTHDGHETPVASVNALGSSTITSTIQRARMATVALLKSAWLTAI